MITHKAKSLNTKHSSRTTETNSIGEINFLTGNETININPQLHTHTGAVIIYSHYSRRHEGIEIDPNDTHTHTRTFNGHSQTTPGTGLCDVCWSSMAHKQTIIIKSAVVQSRCLQRQWNWTREGEEDWGRSWEDSYTCTRVPIGTSQPCNGSPMDTSPCTVSIWFSWRHTCHRYHTPLRST